MKTMERGKDYLLHNILLHVCGALSIKRNVVGYTLPFNSLSKFHNAIWAGLTPQ